MKLSKRIVLASLFAAPCAFAQNVVINFDDSLDGVNHATNSISINLTQQGNMLIGNDGQYVTLSGEVEETNNAFYGSGLEPRVHFKLNDNGNVKWFTGTRNAANVWTGTWYGSNGSKGDFGFEYSDALTTPPACSDVVRLDSDPVFSGGEFDYTRPLNETCLMDTDDATKGIYLQSDTGGLPFPMSFSIELKRNFTIQSFKLGTYNNGQGNRLTTFTLEAWENGAWAKKGDFEFTSSIPSKGFVRELYRLPEAVTTSKIRISATGTADYYNAGRVLMYGLSFH
ncbi:hypothetical protein [Pseudoalteromonas luteoviolacea]|uniref:F5/8 type C domain protein n=1 Tax=Pseudoalteromonas luteoviolacea (strain 2ta16) TaxID=1353533 RepID=V4HU73_PSEL2|nr:hypothetical protein [Pseudoalteromonas luteoviolacea]ESP94350.1 hypothetical protein PL2TA16_01051 [Pseudoalteromonas luteoviolacea 2ta16]KZN36108.1 hypothetical protein N483_22855 [Pseudoalteromonas luteoviolacea NCIMB 1944]